MLKLEFPAEHHKRAWIDICKEFRSNGEKIKPGGLHLKRSLDEYDSFLKKTIENRLGENLENDRVHATLYFLIDEDNKNEILGAVQIRHELNEGFFNTGGHIGYGVRPSKRNAGYASKMLGLALLECKNMGMDKVLVTCNKDNIFSKKVIIKNGGIFENEFSEDNGNIVLRYWILTGGKQE
jgi:predicted acetyltransferase